MTVLLILTGENKAPSMSFKDLEKKNLLFREMSLSLKEKVNMATGLVNCSLPLMNTSSLD